MTSSWDSYYIVFLSGILSLGVPLSLSLISFIFFPRDKSTKQPLRVSGATPFPQKLHPNSEFEPEHRAVLKIEQSINVRFFLAANAALVLIALALELIPCAATIQAGSNNLLIRGLISVISLACFAALGLTYATKKGNMNWLSSSPIGQGEIQEETKSRNLVDSHGE